MNKFLIKIVFIFFAFDAILVAEIIDSNLKSYIIGKWIEKEYNCDTRGNCKNIEKDPIYMEFKSNDIVIVNNKELYYAVDGNVIEISTNEPTDNTIINIIYREKIRIINNDSFLFGNTLDQNIKLIRVGE